MKKAKLFLLTCMMMLLCAPLCVQAKVGSSATGASLPKYKKTVTIKIPKKKADFTKNMKDALAQAEQYATDKKQYKIVIQKGTYTATTIFEIPSNVWIYANNGAVIRPDSEVASALITRTDGKTRKNIRITGGVWDGTKQSNNKKPREYMFVRMSHVRNIIFENATFKVKRVNHILEFSDINGMTIKGRTISGNNQDKWCTYNVQPKEAIQLDVATQAAMPDCVPYNGNGCHNVVVKNNTFVNVARGIGSHNEMNGVEANPYTDITIFGNKIKNTLGEGIFVLHWKNCTIYKNTITNCHRAGIYMEDCSDDNVKSNIVSSLSAYSGKRATYGTNYACVMYVKVKNTTFNWNILKQKNGDVLKNLGQCSGIKGGNNKKA